MKRALVCAGLLVALAFPATTAAGTRSFHGATEPDGTVDFRAKFRHGKPVKVRGSPSHPGFGFQSVPIECDVGTLPGDMVSGYLPFSIEVEGRRFRAKGSDGYTTAKVRGKFFKHGRKARGTVRLHGDFPSLDASGCDTGRDHWSAHRVRHCRQWCSITRSTMLYSLASSALMK